MADFERKVREILKEYGCSFVRHGKGDHDIWHSPITGKRFPIPRHNAKEVTLGTLKDIARKSGVEL